MPVDPHLYLTFLAVMSVMAVTPGPANLFAIAAGVERGRRKALLGVLGMNLATLVWFCAAALGLGALVSAFPGVFRIVAVLGAAYVAWLGLKAFHSALKPAARAPAVIATDPAPSVRGARTALMDGFMVQIANPKAVLFFTAVLPPFIDVARPVAPQLGLFAVAMIGLDALSMSAYALSGAALARRMTEPRFRRIFGVFTGVLLLSAAVMIVLRIEWVPT
ncbi:lysine transporter LysE [Brevundimonas sp. Leaf363]|uniref:LysE family translocator n=1 Tax=Brevundimonas sp. Leaf363 TaxID=1736353 RepID=UPI00070142A5|nr:LysE family translocator [Brevundimonas sp. Leaf363]KQS55146.1 lysine transporter LysE [Brevundimonas sp. Leaf363]